VAQLDIDRLINAFPPGNYSAGGWTIRIDDVRRTVSPSGTQSLIVWGEATKGDKTLTFTQANPLIWTEPKSDANTNNTRALFAALLEGLL
jgi:hypothetical protein